MPGLPIETERLILRAFATGDAETFSRYRSDPEVARYQGWEPPFTLVQAQSFVASMMARRPGVPGEWYQIAIERKSDGLMIGDCGFYRLIEDPRQAEIGFTLASEYQGQGYASEAVSGLLDYLFGELRLHRVRANYDPRNLSSGRLLERVGMRVEGHFVESLWYKGDWVDEMWAAMLRREWEARRKRTTS